jgi:ribulose-5-phosphate 4-epimerase/fuculose-1-phosphate aldolase
MDEEDFAIQFNTVFLDKHIPLNSKIKKLIFWGRKFSLLGLTPNYGFAAAGNLSFRTEAGFIITATGKDMGKLEEEDFVEVRSCSVEKREITAFGKLEPSKESMFHCAIYAKRPDVKVIFHVHDEYAVEHCDEYGLKCTANEKDPGTVELVNEILDVIGEHDYVVIKNHGIISLGSTVDEAGERILEVNSKIKK